MGDLYGAVQVVLRVITPMVSGEVALVGGLKDDIDAIQKELRNISVFLLNAEEKAEGNVGAKEWVRQVRMLAYDIEDVIERYHLFLKETPYSKAKQYLSLEVRSMATTIKTLRETSISIANSKEAYGFNDRVADQQGQSKPQSQFTTLHFQCTVVADNDVVRDDVAKGEIIDLLELQNLTSAASITAVVGMRGLGKTTVLASVYQDETVRTYFPVRAWIRLSEPKEPVEILRSMVSQFTEATDVRMNSTELNSMDKRSLQKLLKTFLKDKRYMVVFDDAQERDTELKTTFKKYVLPRNETGSKILMTTRYENVASAWLDGSINGIYKLKPLPPNRAGDLFLKTTFKSYGGKCPEHLKDLADGIVENCGGLPPAIVSVSRLLSARGNDRNEWEKVRNSLGFYLAENRQLSGINQTFLQNYSDLPYYLKPCFLYFGLFPKGQPISQMRLIRLWIAEGFIMETRGNHLRPEEVAEEYVSEMINMCMIEVKCRDLSGKVRSLSLVSEFLHEMILSKLDELSFCKILSGKDCHGEEASRRLSIQDSAAPESLDCIIQRKSSIRSLFVFEVGSELMLKLCGKAFLKSISLLKVLDLFNAPIDDVPKEIGMLLNLRYLSLRCTRVSTLPSSIGKLENLLTLDLKQTFISELPREVSELSKLRHLLGYYHEYDSGFSAHCLKLNGVSIPEGSLGKCLELQHLGFFDLGHRHGNWAMELKNLTELRKLGIVGLESEEGEALCSIIDGMRYLQTLNVFSTTKNENINLANVSSPPLMLKRLYLNGALASFPTWVCEIHNLVKIQLRWSNLVGDPLETLELLPNLLELQLLEAFVGEELKISSHGFQKLKKLSLLDLHPLRSFSMAQGALPLLQEMSIGESKNLELPSGIKYLDHLKTLNFYNMPSDFCNRIRPGDSDYSIVRHVSNVLCHIKHPIHQ